jgi:four helix bundle protein
MNQEHLKKRAMQLAVDVVRLTEALPRGRASDHFSIELLRSSSLIGAKLRAAFRVRSPRDVTARLNTAIEEANEAQYWLELIVHSNLASKAPAQKLHEELDEIISMTIRALQIHREATESEEEQRPERRPPGPDRRPSGPPRGPRPAPDRRPPRPRRTE